MMAKSLDGINAKLAKFGKLEAKVKKQEKEMITLKSTVAYLDKKLGKGICLSTESAGINPNLKTCPVRRRL